jgi:hypothetical protein
MNTNARSVGRFQRYFSAALIAKMLNAQYAAAAS